MGHLTLSVCMIVKDEEKNLPRALSSIKGLADEIIVVDTGSKDKTVDIAKSFGAKVYYFDWCDDFSAARNESLRYATKDYILWLDGDDELKREEHGKIKKDLIKKRGHAFYLKIKNYTNGGETECIQMRIFPRRNDLRFEGSVHEQIYPSIKKAGVPMALCDATIIHHGYEESEDNEGKLLRNLRILEKDLNKDPENTLTLFFLGRTLRGLGRNEEAAIYYERLIEKGITDGELRASDLYQLTLVERASLLSLKGQVKDAIALLERFGKVNTNNLITFTLAELYYKSKAYEKAYELLLGIRDKTFQKELLPLDVDLVKRSLYKYLGVSSIFVKDYETARKYLSLAIESEPEDPQNYHYLALCEEKAGNIEKAIEVCSEAVGKFDGDISFLKKRFFLKLEHGLFKEMDMDVLLLKNEVQDLEILCGLFFLSSVNLSFESIERYYSAIEAALHLPVKPFPEGYPEVVRRLQNLGEKKSLSILRRAIDRLLTLETKIAL